MSDNVLNQTILDLWHELRTMVDSIEQDVNKNARGVNAAGVRARKGIRLLRKKLGELSKASLAQSSAKKPKDPAQ